MSQNEPIVEEAEEIETGRPNIDMVKSEIIDNPETDQYLP